MLSPFSEAMGDAKGQDQDSSFSLLSQFPHNNMGLLWAVVLWGSICSGMGSPMGPYVGAVFVLPWSTSSSSSQLGAPPAVSHSFFFFPLLPPPVWCFLLFRKYVFIEGPPALLMDSAVSYSGFIAETAGTGCAWHGAAPGPFPQGPPLQPSIAKTLAHKPNST